MSFAVKRRSLHLIRFFTLLIFALAPAGVRTAHGQAVVCPPNIDFSYGNFTNWYCWAGSCSTGPAPVTGGAVISVAFTGPVSGPPPQHEITSGAGTDPFGGFPVVAPGGGLFSMKIGNAASGYGAERVQYYVHVPVGFNNYSFAYKYACVLNDGGSTHDSTQQAAMRIIAYDSATGFPIPCATISYIVDNNRKLPGFYTSSVQSDVECLAWTNGTLNLSGQGGKTIIVEVTTNDCTQGGHFGYGYFDIISCGQFAAAVTYCNLSAGYATLNAPSGYKTYKWFKGPTISGAPLSTSQSVNVPVGGPCIFYYCVLDPYNSNGCPDTIRTRTICDFAVDATPDTVCNSLGNPIQLNVTQTGGLGGKYTYSWLPNPTLSALNIPNPIATPKGSGIYVVTVADSINCTRSDTVVIQNPSYNVNLGPDITTCLGSPVTLKPTMTPTAPGYVYKWRSYTATSPSMGKINNPTIERPTFTPTPTSSITTSVLDTFILRVDSGVCADDDTMIVRTLPNAFDVHDTAVCKLAQVTPFVNGHAAFTYSWAPANVPGLLDFTGAPNGMKPTITADTTRTFFITAKYPGCPDVVRQLVFDVEPLPTVDLGQDVYQKCFYTPLYITAHTTPTWFTNYTYQWTANDFIDAPTSPIISFTGPKDTTLIVTVTTPLGCTGIDSARVLVYQGSFGTVTPSDTAVCPRNPVTMTATGGTSYLWRPSLYLSDSTGATITANPETTTDYTLYVTDRNGCVDTLPVTLQVYADALVSLPDSAVLYPGQSYQLDPGGNALYFTWFPTVGLSNPSIANPEASPLVNTRYFVTGTSESGCKSTDSIYIMVHEESLIGMPNAFTPGTGANETFKVSRLGIASLNSFRIYNRWGTRVFETSNIDKGWDGTFNGQPQPIGVYVYTVEAVNNKGKAFTKHGNVTLLR